MRLHSTIALAALAVAIAAPSAAMAKPRHAANRAAPVEGNLTVAEQLQMAQQQMAQMQAQLNALQARLDAQAASTTPPPAVADATRLATEANAKADKALAAATATQASVAKTDKKVGSMAWAADTKVSGRMYFNMSSINADNAAGANVEKDGGFQIKRFYVGIDHKFSDVFSGNVTADVDNVADTTGKLIGKGFYIKKAYLQAKLSPAAVIRLGAYDTPWIPYAEGIYGYRHIEKTVSDLNNFGTSSDWGVHVGGELADGLVNYQVSAVNGAGYRNPTLTQHIDLEGRVNLVYKGFNVGVGGYTGKLGNDKVGTTTLHTASRFNALAAYKGNVDKIGYTVGVEYLYAKNWKRVVAVAEDSSEGYSVFASVAPLPKWSMFGRYDFIKPSKTLAPAQHDNFYQLGIQWEPAKIVDLALVYKRDKAAGGLITGNLTGTQQTRNEIGIYGQFRF